MRDIESVAKDHDTADALELRDLAAVNFLCSFPAPKYYSVAGVWWGYIDMPRYAHLSQRVKSPLWGEDM